VYRKRERERKIKGVGKFQLNNVKMTLFLNLTKDGLFYFLLMKSNIIFIHNFSLLYKVIPVPGSGGP
jgi:hypothetical protein